MGKGFFILLAIIFLISIILAPLITYSYLTNTYDSELISCRNKIEELQQQVDSLTEQNRQLIEENANFANLTKPHLVTALGWYLHRSNDTVASSRNTFTIYGRIYNIGQLPASNVELTIKFYGGKTLLQTSTVHVGVVPSITNSTMSFELGKTNVDCSIADSITDVEVSLSYQ